MVRSAAAGFALCLGALCVAESQAQSRNPREATAKAEAPGRLGDMLLEPSNGRRSSAPRDARYVVESSTSFIFDQSSGLSLIRFDGSTEVWVLTAQSERGGVTVYKNEVGEPVLRVSRLGGMTVYTSARPEGAQAALAGGGASLRLAPITNALLTLGQLGSASRRASLAASREVGFDAGKIDDPKAYPLLADTAEVVAEAFVRVTKTEKFRSKLRNVQGVVFLEGVVPSAKLEEGQLIITIVPGRGFAGRPSSAKIERLLRG